MSIDQQPARTGFDTDPPRGLGERIAVIAGVLVTVLAVAGIAFIATRDNEPATAPPSSPSAPSATATPGTDAPTTPPAVQTPQDLAAAEAESRYRAFIELQDQVAQSGFVTADTAYDEIAISPAQTDLIIEGRQLAGTRVTGSTEIASLSILAVELTDDPERSRSTVQIRACLDVTGIGVVDEAGNPVSMPTRLDRIESTVTMELIPAGAFTDTPARQGWFVMAIDQPGEPC